MKARDSGFTAIELLIVMVIVSILLAVAGPSIERMIRVQRVKTASFDVFSSLSLARSEAIKRNVSVTLTPTGGNWANGWTIADANANVVRQQQALGNGIALTGPASLTYTGSGRLSSVLATPFALTGTNVPPEQQRCVKVDLSGRPVSFTGVCP
jgi:type IV fimbrial biogenesis protein FimT